jgi:purine-binding chemotaxis protein CheW
MVSFVESATDQLLPVLLVRTQAWYCALPIGAVTETCRPLPTQSVDGVPAYVRGIAVIRGESTPVLHLGSLLAGGKGEPGRRFVTVKLHGRPVAFEVDEVIGVRRLSRDQVASAKPLVSGGLTERIGELGVLDGQLLAWLDTGRLLGNDLLDLILSEGWV